MDLYDWRRPRHDSRHWLSTTNPANGASSVGTNQNIVATFDKGMDSSTLTAATFTLMGPGVTPVLGTVTYSTIGDTATFTPSVPLTASILLHRDYHDRGYRSVG